MGQRITWLSDTVSTGGEVLRFKFWMRGDASPPRLHVHPRQEERIQVISGSVRSVSGGVERVLGPSGTISMPPGEGIPSGPLVERTFGLIVPAISKAGVAPCSWRPRNRTRPSSSCRGCRSGYSEPCCVGWIGWAGRCPARAADDGRGCSRAVASGKRSSAALAMAFLALEYRARRNRGSSPYYGRRFPPRFPRTRETGSRSSCTRCPRLSGHDRSLEGKVPALAGLAVAVRDGRPTEREGFEPSDEVDPRHTISSRARSAAPAPLRAVEKGTEA